MNGSAPASPSGQATDVLQETLEDALYKLFESDDFLNSIGDVLRNSENTEDDLLIFMENVLPKKIVEVLPLYSLSIKNISIKIAEPDLDESSAFSLRSNRPATFLLIAAKHDIGDEPLGDVRKTFVLTSHISFISLNTDVRIGAYLELEDAV